MRKRLFFLPIIFFLLLSCAKPIGTGIVVKKEIYYTTKIGIRKDKQEFSKWASLANEKHKNYYVLTIDSKIPKYEELTVNCKESFYNKITIGDKVIILKGFLTTKLEKVDKNKN